MTYNLVFRYIDVGRERAELPVSAQSLSECSALTRAFILNNELGANDWIAGEVYEKNSLVAKLAYNGRIVV